jgi:hypothetical protein
VNFESTQVIKWIDLIPPTASLQSRVNPCVSKQGIFYED